MSCTACEQAQRPCDGTCGPPHAPVPIATTFGAFGGTRAGRRAHPLHAPRVRPAGDVAETPRTTNPPAATTAATNTAAREDAGLQVGRQVIGTTTDAIAREQERARQEQEQRARERLAEIQAQRDVELARIRANAEAALAQRDANSTLATPPRAEFTVLGVEAAQNVNARPAAATADSGVLAWVKEHPVPTAIGVAVVLGGIAYYVKTSKKRGRR